MTDKTLVATDASKLHVLAPSASGTSVILPNATTLAVGAKTFQLENASSQYAVTIKNALGTVLGTLAAQTSLDMHLTNNATQVGAWALRGVDIARGWRLRVYTQSDTWVPPRENTEVFALLIGGGGEGGWITSNGSQSNSGGSTSLSGGATKTASGGVGGFDQGGNGTPGTGYQRGGCGMPSGNNIFGQFGVGGAGFLGIGNGGHGAKPTTNGGGYFGPSGGGSGYVETFSGYVSSTVTITVGAGASGAGHGAVIYMWKE